MASDNEKVLKKLKKVGNPMFLLRMINEVTKFIASHQMNEKAINTETIYADISGVSYKFNEKKLDKIKGFDGNAAYVKVSQTAINEVAELISSDNEDLNKLLKDLRKVRNLKLYKEILNILDSSFEINISLTQLIKFIF
ncbi:hypothetical protein ACQUFH_01225 [Lactococcus lactis]|uniref:hypothetical protein n=1 Tax=Lactococcus lactis TaxID=1358 RepID=UPI003D10AC50